MYYELLKILKLSTIYEKKCKNPFNFSKLLFPGKYFFLLPKILLITKTMIILKSKTPLISGINKGNFIFKKIRKKFDAL